MYGLDGSIYKSQDDGSTWRDLSVQTDSNITAGIVLDTGQVLVSTLTGNLYISDRQADSLHELALSLPFEISGMAIAPDGNIVVVGNGGAVVLPVQSLQ